MQLQLENNQLNEFPARCSIGQLTNLEVLKFEGNNIKALPKSFQNLTQLPSLIVIRD